MRTLAWQVLQVCFFKVCVFSQGVQRLSLVAGLDCCFEWSSLNVYRDVPEQAVIINFCRPEEQVKQTLVRPLCCLTAYTLGIKPF